MGRKTSLAIAFAGTLLLSRSALALAESLDPYPFVFEAAPTIATSICADPCYQLRIYVEDHTRTLSIGAMQMDIDVMDGAMAAELPVYPATNTNADGGNATYDGRSLPWAFTAIARSPRTEYDALLLNHAIGNVGSSVGFWDIERLLEFYGANCEPAETCQIIASGEALDRIYLGRFNVSRANDPLADGFEVRVGEIVVVGPRVVEQALEQANGRTAFVLYPVPEPRSALLLGAMLACLGVMRRRSCPSPETSHHVRTILDLGNRECSPRAGAS